MYVTIRESPPVVQSGRKFGCRGVGSLEDSRKGVEAGADAIGLDSSFSTAVPVELS